MTATLDRDLLARIGTALYGEHWQADMARALRRSPHTVSRWATGKTRGPSTVVWQSLLSQLNEKHSDIEAVISEMAALLIQRRDHTGNRSIEHVQPSVRP
jgi:hypothetical protein